MALFTGDDGMVMVVDDSDDIRELICAELRMLGYEVVEAANGREAVEFAQVKSPALILMDIQMPVLDGLAATRLIRSTKGLGKVVIVAFSSFNSGGNRQLALEAGCDDYVNKTDGITQLPSLVRRYLAAP